MTRRRFDPSAAVLGALLGLWFGPVGARGAEPLDAVGQVSCRRASNAEDRARCLEDALDHGRFCSATAFVLRDSCGGEVEEAFHVGRGICYNVNDADERGECLDEALAERTGANRECGEQMRWRLSACGVVGEDPYDPQFDPADFDSDYHHLTHPNPYFPLGIGNRWEYVSGSEFNVVEVLDRTKLIEGVTCAVLQDQVFDAGDLHESTYDWFCQKRNGDVHYFGEDTATFESFDGDNPRLPEQVSHDGSFKHGRDGDKGGLIFLAAPHVGDAYLEEHSLGNAEDVSEVVSTTYSYGVGDPELDLGVPPALAALLCSNDCVVTKNYSLLSPGVLEFKYYARGIGVFVETEEHGAVTVQLTGCNFDARCDHLPQP